MSIRRALGRLGRTSLAVLVVVGVSGVLFAAHAGAQTQATNFNIAVMSPGQDQGTLNGFQRCTGTQGVFNQGYYAFPSKQSTIDNGLQTNIGNDQGMLKLSFSLPSSVNSGTINLSAPNPPRPVGVPGNAPWGTRFATDTGFSNPAAASLYGCNMSASSVPAGSQFLTYYYVIQIQVGSTTYFNFPGGVNTNPSAPNQVGIPFGFPAGASSSTSRSTSRTSRTRPRASTTASTTPSASVRRLSCRPRPRTRSPT